MDVTALEITGGLAILLGTLVTLAAVPLIATMLVAMFTVHFRYGFSSINTIGLTPAGPLFGPPGYEINLLYIAGLLALILNGPGPLSVRHARSVLRRSRPLVPSRSAPTASPVGVRSGQ